jgi:hypothetical protein
VDSGPRRKLDKKINSNSSRQFAFWKGKLPAGLIAPIFQIPIKSTYCDLVSILQMFFLVVWIGSEISKTKIRCDAHQIVSDRKGYNMAKTKGIDLGNVVKQRDLNEEIAKVAYDLYEKRGKSSGSDLDDWLKAEKIVMDRYAKLKKDEINVMSEVAEKVTEKVAVKKRQRKQAAFR